MKNTRKSRLPSPAMGVAILALCVSLVGTAFAGPIAEISVLNKKDKRTVRKISNRIANKRITKRAPGLSVNAANTAGSANTVIDGAILTDKLADESVTSGKLAKDSVLTDKIANDAVSTDKIGNDQVTGAKVKESTLGQVPSAANAAALGGVAASGYARRMFAKVNYTTETESLAAGSPGISVTTEGGLGFPRLVFPQSMTNCAIVGNATSNSGTQIFRRSGGGGATVQFAIKDETGAAVRADFQVIAIC